MVSLGFIVRELDDGSGKETNVQWTVVGTTAVCVDGETTSGITSYAAARAFLSGMNLEASRVTSHPGRVYQFCVFCGPG